MRKLALIVTIITLLVILPHLSLAETNMQPGRRVVSSTIDMPGMAFRMPATKHTQCINKEDLVPKMPSAHDMCQTLKCSIDGDTVTWEMTCEPEGGMMTS